MRNRRTFLLKYFNLSAKRLSLMLIRALNSRLMKRILLKNFSIVNISIGNGIYNLKLNRGLNFSDT